MQSVSKQRLKSNTLGLPELARLEDIFVRSFEEAVEKGVPDDAAGLKRLRTDVESILTEANKRSKLLAMELTKIYDMVEDPPEIETIDDEVLLQAWKDKTIAEINEVEELEKNHREVSTVQVSSTPKASAVRRDVGSKGVPRSQRRNMIPWPANVPFIWRDSMRVRFTVNGH
mmetsp:Transcript_22544/g.73935  ORF Transcript_22544/g.73935 Transcript_22544/m.73935 type:complete len:172 (+) Transcript_22544:115-630(+)